MLQFANHKEHVDPRHGMLCYGPKSYRPTNRHPASVRVGFIGTAQSIEISHTWIDRSSTGVPGDASHPEFPGFAPDRGFYSKLEYDHHWNETLSQDELATLGQVRSKRERFEGLLALLDEKLKVLARKDLAPQYIVLALPTDLYSAYRIVEYRDKALGQVHRDLRRAFKATAMKHRIPTQLLRERTAAGLDPDHPSKIAWNFFTGLYFKAGGFPWGPLKLLPGTCYMGISFFRPLGNANSTVRTSMVQAFDEHGDGLVLRGPDFTWDEEANGTASPHLTDEDAAALVKLALDQYELELKQTPQRIVIHKTSRFWEAEKQGLRRGLRGRVQAYDFVALAPQSDVRLMPVSNYPCLRGTRFSVDDIDFLYTTGFIAELGQFHSMHVPAPLQIADHIGSDTQRDQIVREILILTKMNWNSARLGGLLPITLRFSKLVGNIMREIPPGVEPLSNYKYYM
jgi:hypothetical protein